MASKIWKQTLDMISSVGGAATTARVAQMRGCSLDKARTHLNSLHHRGLLHRDKVDGVNVWILVEDDTDTPSPRPQQRVKVEEISPGHRRVSFMDGWRAQPAQHIRHHQQGISGAGLCTLQGD